ncbi:YhcN/YlaJ family sporulation lipoprotein [Paenibacillaceae bacterium WGS1546]|uniref:YhcN/YlaJ family sporulation lipoprotein n=1 Tax=Cohnella sp. WGS1546 TaxID=3366810 RepID=UPI00372D6E1C
MRKGFIAMTVLLCSAIAMSACMARTGDVGNKNIRNNAARQNVNRGYESNEFGLRGNGTKMRFADDEANMQNRINGRQRVNNGVVGMHGNSRLELSDKMADKIAAIPGISSAYVMLTDRNAYVAVVEDDRANTGATSETDTLKDKVANQVKSLSPLTQNVYVSSNPDFIGRMEGYANDVRAGHPVQGFLTEFNAMVERIFPAASGVPAR